MNILEEKIGYRFRSPDLLEEALRHASLTEGKTRKSYQRLEYLGDAVLNLCIAEETYRTFPYAEEGTLSKTRSAMINNRNLVRVGEKIGIPDILRVDSSVAGKGGGVTPKMVADAVEAITGAIFLDGGYDAAKRFVITHFWKGKEAGTLAEEFDSKSRLQEWCQKNGTPLPRYRLISSEGPPHSRIFCVSARLSDGREARGNGKTKKEAEMEAAARLLSLLQERKGNPAGE